MIRSIRHKGLKRLYEDDDQRGVLAEHVAKLRDLGCERSCKLAGYFPL